MITPLRVPQPSALTSAGAGVLGEAARRQAGAAAPEPPERGLTFGAGVASAAAVGSAMTTRISLPGLACHRNR